MKIHWSPQSRSTIYPIEIINENTIKIDGEDYEFPIEHVDWPDVAKITDSKILSAQRIDGVLNLVVLRPYIGSHQPNWDVGDFQEVSPGVIQ